MSLIFRDKVRFLIWTKEDICSFMKMSILVLMEMLYRFKAFSVFLDWSFFYR